MANDIIERWKASA